jgi:hypothetical protein
MSARRLSVVLLIVAAVACGGEANPELKRAREHMAGQRWANARTALVQALKAEPRSKVARAMLLSCLDQEEGLRAVVGLPMYLLFEVTGLQSSPAWRARAPEDRAVGENALVEMRKSLFDRGIDTKDSAELAALLVEAGRQELAVGTDPERKETAAAMVAIGAAASSSEADTAIAFLIERLKGTSTGRAVEYLVDVGALAVPALRRVIVDRGFMGRASALEALARILASERARALVAREPGLRAFARDEEGVPGASKLGASAIPDFRELGLERVHGQYLALSEDRETAVLLLQAWDDSRSRVSSQLYAFRAGAIRPVRVVDSAGKPVELSSSLIYKLEGGGRAVTLYRDVEETSTVEVDAGPLSRPRPGARVRIQGHDVRGVLLREEEGLWVVKADAPVQGLTELPVAPASLFALRPEPRTARITERLEAELREDELQIETVEK